MLIDTHSHFGNDYYCGKIFLEDYIKFCEKTGINIGFVMPSPWPKYHSRNVEITSLIWEHENYVKKYYYSVNEFGSKRSIEKNPYKYVNYEYFNNTMRTCNNNVNLYFVPMIHGTLDRVDYLEKLYDDMNPIAFKIHGFSSGFSPKEIKPEIISFLKYINIPIIIHTSVYNYDYGYGAETKYWRNECHPYIWAKFIEDNGLKGVLNHGACLNRNAIDLVNDSENLMIGIGPDLDISNDYFKVDISKEEYKKIDYLMYLKENTLSKKLLFDIDFNWNVSDNNEVDSQQVERISSIWDNEDLDNILYKNALDFFEIKKKLKEK